MQWIGGSHFNHLPLLRYAAQRNLGVAQQRRKQHYDKDTHVIWSTKGETRYGSTTQPDDSHHIAALLATQSHPEASRLLDQAVVPYLAATLISLLSDLYNLS